MSGDMHAFEPGDLVEHALGEYRSGDSCYRVGIVQRIDRTLDFEMIRVYWFIQGSGSIACHWTTQIRKMA